VRAPKRGTPIEDIPQPQQTVRTVRLLDMVQGDPPFIVIAERLHNRCGKERTFTQQVHVLDGCMFQRLRAEMQKGDELQVVIVTEFAAEGYRTHLVAFHWREGHPCREGQK
jgi:hypothetical protein